MKNSLRPFLAAVCLVALPFAAGSAFAKEGWGENQQAALAKAKSEKKLILMDFTGSDWCGWCIKMDKEVFDTAEFKAFAKDNLVLVELDYPNKKQLAPETVAQNEKLQKQYSVDGFPTLIVLDSEGKTLKTFGGYQKGGAAAFIAELKKLQS